MKSFVVLCNNRLVLLLYVVALGGYSVDAAFTVEPVNTVALSGRSVRLNCTTRQGGLPAEIGWRRIRGTNGDGIVGLNCQASPSFPQYSVVRDMDGQCDLVISSSSLELAATYRCGDSNFDNVDAELTVIESCPTCNQSSINAAIGDTITMTCSINYLGSSVPDLQWSPGSSATNCSNSGTVCSSLSVKIENGTKTVESQSCSVTFPSAVHVPQCNNWTSTEITVSYLSTTLTITGAVNNSDATLNDGSVVLVCHADGHPAPTYRWLDISNSGQATDGSVYTISTAGEYSLECTASNDVTFADGRIVPHSVSARFYVNATGAVPTTTLMTSPSTSTTGSPTTAARPSGTSLLSSTTSPQTKEPDDNLPLIIGLTVGLGALLIILILVLILCCCIPSCPLYGKCCKKDKQDRYEAGPSEDGNTDGTAGQMPMTNLGYQESPRDPYSPDIVRDNKPYSYSPDNGQSEPVVYAQLQVPAKPRSRTPVVEPSNAVYGQIVSS